DSFTFTVSDGSGGSIGATAFNITLSPLAVSVTDLSTYSQNFNTLPASGASSAFPLVGKGPFGLDATPLGASGAAGWGMGEFSGTGGTANFEAADGNANNNRLVSYGTTGSTDRAIGTFAGSSLIGAFGVVFVNNSGSVINSVDVAYTGEQWSYGNSSPDANAL